MSNLPIYLLECHVWSDGEDDHEEDHNVYYDVKYFYVKNDPTSKIAFTWNAYHGDIKTGILYEFHPAHAYELEAEILCDSISVEEACALVRHELDKLTERYNNAKYKNEIEAAQAFLEANATHCQSVPSSS